MSAGSTGQQLHGRGGVAGSTGVRWSSDVPMQQGVSKEMTTPLALPKGRVAFGYMNGREKSYADRAVCRGVGVEG